MNLLSIDDWPAFAAAHDYSVKAIASHFNVSVRHLHRVFRAQLKKLNPAAWLEQLRLRQAVTLLREGTLSLKEIAGRLRYSQASAFARALRRWLGFSPKEFRRRPASGVAKAQVRKCMVRLVARGKGIAKTDRRINERP